VFIRKQKLSIDFKMKTWYNIGFFLILILVFFFEKDVMFLGVDLIGVDAISTLVYSAPMFFISIFLILLFQKKIPHCTVSRSFFALMAIVYIITLFYSLYYPLTTKEDYIKIPLPLLLFYFMTLSTCYFKKDTIIIWMYSLIVFLLSIYYVQNYRDNIFGTIVTTGASYNILYLLPFTLCLNNKVFRVFFVIIIAVILLLSMKLGGILAFIAALSTYLYVSQFKLQGRSFNFWGIVLISIAVIVMVYLFTRINEDVVGGVLTQRMDNIGETGGSGRLEVYKGYIDFISNDTLAHYLFGHGWWGSIRDSRVDATCHNDFLECFIDFGIFGFIAYAHLLVALFKRCMKMIKARHEYAAAMAASMAMFFVNSMVSHILIYPKFSMIFALFWGFIISSTRNINCIQKYKNENRVVNLSRSL